MATIIIYYGHYNKLFSVTDRKNLTITVFFKPPINGLGDVKSGFTDNCEQVLRTYYRDLLKVLSIAKLLWSEYKIKTVYIMFLYGC